ncbi:MAG: PadR family transcriptional regulator [Bryobacterales bacterium]|nr:PadR family transcriptional regulator [Bryobacterales bacterium]
MSKSDAILQGTLHVLILQILSLEPMTGWSVSARLRQMSNETLHVSHGSLYPSLHKLEQQGWITGEWKESATGRQVKFYSLTRAGRAHLRKETDSWARLSTAVNGILGLS